MQITVSRVSGYTCVVLMKYFLNELFVNLRIIANNKKTKVNPELPYTWSLIWEK